MRQGGGPLGRLGQTLLDTSPITARFLATVTVVLIVFAALPSVLGYVTAGPGETFLAFVEDWPDTFDYFAATELAQQGYWMAPFQGGRPEERGAAFRPLYILLAAFSAVTGVPIPEAHLLGRLLFTALLVPVVFFLLRDQLQEANQIRFALLSLLFGSGFGYLTGQDRGVNPTDLWHTGTVLFFSCSALVHLVASWCGLLLAYFYLGRSLRRKSRRDAVLGGGFLCLNGLIHPYHYVSGFVIACLATLWEWRSTRDRAALENCGIFLAIGGLSFGINVVIVLTQPIVRQVAANALNPSPPPWDYLLGFGVAGLLAMGALCDFRSIPGRQRVPLAWLLVCLPLLYSYHTPLAIRFERRFADMLVVPMIILGTSFLFRRILPAVERTRGRGTVGLLLVVLLVMQLPSNGVVFMRFCRKAMTGIRPYTLATAEVVAARKLKELAGFDDVVMSYIPASSFIPALSGVATVIGHPHWRLGHHAVKERTRLEYWLESSQANRTALLKELGVTLVYIGPAEEALISFDPTLDATLDPVHDEGGVRIFRVRLLE